MSPLTLRRDVVVKLTPDPTNCLILKNGFNLYRLDFYFATFNILFIAFNLAHLVHDHADRDALLLRRSRQPLRATRVVAIMTSKSLTLLTGDFDEMLSQDVCKIEYRLHTHFYII